MQRLPASPPLALVAVLATGGLLAGCATEGDQRTMVTEDGMIAPSQDEAASTRKKEPSDDGAGVGEWALTVPQNVVWWPWKVVGTMSRGLWDGGAAGFKNSDYPLFGVVFLPLNVVTGGVTGLVEGVAMGPGVITPEDDFTRTMSLPTSRPTTIWWYE